MTKKELTGKLQEERIAHGVFSLEGMKPGALCLLQMPGAWRVAYYESDGSLGDERVFNSEKNACNFFYFALKKDDAAR